MATILGIHHVAIRSVNIDASVRFYTEVLGLQVRVTWGAGHERAAMIDLGDGNYLEIFQRGAFSTAESTLLHFALRTDDCSAMLEKVRAAGSEITMESKDIEMQTSCGMIPIKIAFFKGPDGEIIELFENSTL